MIYFKNDFILMIYTVYLKMQQTLKYNNQLRYIKLSPDAVEPTRGSPNSAGLDLYVKDDTILKCDGKVMLLHTGIAMHIPDEHYGRIAPRSGLAMKNIDVKAGVVDCDYRGEICVLLVNNGFTDYEFKRGDKIAQMIITKVLICDVVQVESLDETERGEGGFGSTGK